MSRIYVAGHPAKRFDDDFVYLSMFPETCVRCGGRIDGIKTPLEYYWDDEFQSEHAKQLHNRKVFWGSFLLIVPRAVRDALQDLSAFEFYDTCPVKTELVGRELIVEHLAIPNDAFYWGAKPRMAVVARVSGTPNDTCASCGFFTGHPRQLTRLLVDGNEVPSSGIFSVAQNREPQVFVTEEAKQRLSNLGIAAKFYSAGRIE